MSAIEIILKAHSGLRWLVVLAGLITIIKLLMTWVGNKNYGKGDRTLLRILIGLMDLMFLLGLILLILIWSQVGSPGGFRIEHAVTNLIAIALAHFAVKKFTAQSPITARNILLCLLVSFALIAVAVTRLPQGWTPS